MITARNNLRVANAALTRLVGSSTPVTAQPSDTLDLALTPIDSAALVGMLDDGPDRAGVGGAAGVGACRAPDRADALPPDDRSHLPAVGGNGFDKYFGIGGQSLAYTNNVSVRLTYPLLNNYQRETPDQHGARAGRDRRRDRARRAPRRAADVVQQLAALRAAQQRIALQQASVRRRGRPSRAAAALFARRLHAARRAHLAEHARTRHGSALIQARSGLPCRPRAARGARRPASSSDLPLDSVSRAQRFPLSRCFARRRRLQRQERQRASDLDAGRPAPRHRDRRLGHRRGRADQRRRGQVEGVAARSRRCPSRRARWSSPATCSCSSTRATCRTSTTRPTPTCARREARLEVSEAQKKRTDELFEGTHHHGAGARDGAARLRERAVGARPRAHERSTSRKQRLEDATVRAPVAGTIIEKTVSLGQVIASATSALGGGTTLLKMADLSQVRVRALVQRDRHRHGAAGPDGDRHRRRVSRPPVPRHGREDRAAGGRAAERDDVPGARHARRTVEGLLKPGHERRGDGAGRRRDDVLAVPNDAVRNTREAAATAPMLGLDADSVRSADARRRWRRWAAAAAARAAGR